MLPFAVVGIVLVIGVLLVSIVLVACDGKDVENVSAVAGKEKLIVFDEVIVALLEVMIVESIFDVEDTVIMVIIVVVSVVDAVRSGVFDETMILDTDVNDPEEVAVVPYALFSEIVGREFSENVAE